MALKYRSIAGTNDILPQESSIWRHLEEEARKLFSTFGYKEIRTPILEPTELFIRSVGANTDIVEKEMYTFTDRDNKSISLRPEETAGVIRAYLQNGLYARQSLWKLFYISPVFRRERPQAGRFRQFHQIGAEVIGSYSAGTDAETIIWIRDYFKLLGVSDWKLKINSAGCDRCRPAYAMQLRSELANKIGGMCSDCQRRYKRNIFRVLDCKQPRCREVISRLPVIQDFLCPKCREHFEELKGYLDAQNISYEITPHLVRGLDYYTRTVYEFTSGGLGSQNAVAAGGRYDFLVQEMGGQPAGAVGFSIGLERLIMSLKPIMNQEGRLDIYLISLDKKSYNLNFSLLEKLRGYGISSDIDFEQKSVKSQMRTANKLNARYVIVRGSDEVKKDIITLKDMNKGTEEKIQEKKALNVLRKRLVKNSEI